MSDKQDRVAPRTAMDIERKYNFGKKFSEILGLIDDSREKVDSAVSGLRNEITKTATQLKRDTEEIVAEATKEIVNDVAEVSQRVELKVDASAVNIAIEQRISEGVDQVITEAGYRFDGDGLNITRTGEEMSNRLDNTGMYVTRAGDEILTANNRGVTAVNLHAKTYLTIGEGGGRSRIEDYKTDRTGVFWIGTLA